MNKMIDIVTNKEYLYTGNLNSYFRVIFSAPNVNNPYHNFRHMMHVTCSCYEAAKYERLEHRRTRNLLIAALFHDYGHSGRMGNDDQKIRKSINALSDFLNIEDSPYWAEITATIRSTKWPHSHDYHLSEEMKIIRDADFSQTLDDVWLQQTIFGLAKESRTSALTMLDRQVEFLSDLEFYSDWGRQILKPKIKGKIEEVNALLDMLLLT